MEKPKYACPHCGADLEDVGIRVYYEYFQDEWRDGSVATGEPILEEAKDAECGNPKCRGNLKKYLDGLDDKDDRGEWPLI